MTIESANSLTAAAPLRAQAVRGIKIASFTTVGKTLVDMLAQLVVVRMLLPEHFGLFAFIQAITGLVSCFSDFAGQKYLVRAETFDRRAFSTVFWVEIAAAILVAGGWAIACVPILTLLGRADQILVAQVLALWIVAERFMLPRVLMDRSLQFGRINAAQFAGVIAGSLTLVVTALLRCGAWVLVAGLLARTVVKAVFFWSHSPERPRLMFDRAIARELLRFGLPLSLATAVTFAYTNVDYLIVEFIAGGAALGFYYAAYRYPHYLNQFNVIISSVVFPAFAKTTDDPHLARGLRLLTRYTAAFAFAPAIAMWIEGEFLLRVLLGEKWLPALFPFQCFTTLAALRLAFVHWNQVFVIKGITRPVMVVSLINLPLVSIAAFLGVWFAGIEGAAVAVTLSSLAMLFVCCFGLLKRVLTFSYLDALQPVLRSTLGALVVMLLLRALPIESLAWSAVVLLVGSIAYTMSFYHQTAEEIRRLRG